MNNHLSRYSVLALIALSSIGNVIFADCPLDTVPSPAIRDWEKNVDALIDEAKKLSGSASQCTKPQGYPSHLDVAIPAHSVVNLLGRMRAVGQNVSALISEVRYYFDNSAMTLPAEQNHQNSILAIQKKIELAAVYIGSRCTQGYTFKSDVSLQGSKYKTTGFTIEQVLKDLSSQNTEVIKFYRNLVRNVRSEEYKNDELFTIAPEGFTKAMKEFYSTENLQKCHDADPKNVKIKEALKKAFTIGWKYPQAIKIWKDAFALLLYRSGSLVGATETDAAKEAQIKNIVQAQKGGIGNSRFMINSQFFKEFGRRGSNQTVLEQVKETGKRIAYELYGPIFRRQVMEDVARSSTSTASANLVKYAEVNQDAKELQTVDRTNYDSYGYRKIFVGQNKEQDPKTVTGLFQALDELEKAEATIKENRDLACNDVLNKQATNITHPTCADFIKG